MILGEQDVTLTRRAAGAVGSDGRYAPGASTTSTIRASMQPPNDRLLQLLPEARRQSVTLMAFTEVALRTTDQATGLPADLLTYRGETYEVLAVRQWPTAGPLPHYESALTRSTETGGTP